MAFKIRKAVIPIAGLGTRFLPATKAIPKEMIPIIDKPMVQTIVEEARAAGIDQFVFITARNKDAIIDHFDYRYELEDTLLKKGKEDWAQVSRSIADQFQVVSIRQKAPLGLGHAILCAEPVVGNEPFAVLLGDDLMVSDRPAIGDLMALTEATGLSSVSVMNVPREDVQKYGIVKASPTKNPGEYRVETLIEKPDPKLAPSTLAIPGRYVLMPSVFKYLHQITPGAGGEIQLTDALVYLAKNEGLLAKEYTGIRFDTGDKLGYLEATVHFALEREEFRDSFLKIMKRYTAKYEGAKK